MPTAACFAAGDSLQMEIVYDPAKNKANLRQHKVSLQRAQSFDFDAALFDVDNSQDYGEVRYNAIGWIDGQLYSLTFTLLEADAIVRAISLRKAEREEQERYAKEF